MFDAVNLGNGVRLDRLDFLRHDADLRRPAERVTVAVDVQAVIKRSHLLNVRFHARIAHHQRRAAKLTNRLHRAVPGVCLHLPTLHVLLVPHVRRAHNVKLSRRQARNQAEQSARALLIDAQQVVVVLRRLLPVAQQGHKVLHIGAGLVEVEIAAKLVLIDPIRRVRQLRLLPKLAVLKAKIRAELPILHSHALRLKAKGGKAVAVLQVHTRSLQALCGVELPHLVRHLRVRGILTKKLVLRAQSLGKRLIPRRSVGVVTLAAEVGERLIVSLRALLQALIDHALPEVGLALLHHRVKLAGCLAVNRVSERAEGVNVKLPSRRTLRAHVLRRDVRGLLSNPRNGRRLRAVAGVARRTDRRRHTLGRLHRPLGARLGLPLHRLRLRAWCVKAGGLRLGHGLNHRASGIAVVHAHIVHRVKRLWLLVGLKDRPAAKRLNLRHLDRSVRKHQRIL